MKFKAGRSTAGLLPLLWHLASSLTAVCKCKSLPARLPALSSSLNSLSVLT